MIWLSNRFESYGGYEKFSFISKMANFVNFYVSFEVDWVLNVRKVFIYFLKEFGLKIILFLVIYFLKI